MAIRQQYLYRLAALSQGATHVVDKNLMNFHFAGLIASAFPDAVILHMVRDPMAVCWSNYRQNFASDRLSFAFDLDDLGAYYGRYERLMAFWHSRFAGCIHDVDYNGFTQSPEDRTRALLDHCGLSFEDACLKSHEGDSAVRTASLFQVREKVYRDSSRDWERYRSHLADFAAKYFGPSLAD